MIDPTGHLDTELSEFLDDELTAEERTRVGEHVANCPACAARLDELRAVVAGAQDLEDLPPDQDLWPGIARRLEPGSARLGRLIRPAPIWARRLSLTIPQLAAAGFAVALLSAAGAWWAVRGGLGAGGLGAQGESVAVGSGASSSTDATGTGATGESAALARLEDGTYDQAVAELERTLAQHRDRLDPKTVAEVQANLEAIDDAILKARRALAADPSDPYLNSHLAEQMKRKVRVLQYATEAVTADYAGS